MIFGLFFRIGVLLVLVLAIGHAIAVDKGTGFRVALPSIEMCFVLAGLLFIGPVGTTSHKVREKAPGSTGMFSLKRRTFAAQPSA